MAIDTVLTERSDATGGNGAPDPQFQHLFQPGRIGNLRLRNRVVKSPNTTATSNADGTVSSRTVNHYRRLGEGGIGLVLLEYTYVDDDASQSIHAQTGMSRQDHVAGMGWLVDEVHSTGAAVGLQLVHSGRQRFLGTAPMKSASTSSWDVAAMPFGVTPQRMSVEEIHGVVRSFGEAAARAYQARFDLVEVHAGHGYMITNFLSPHTNDREDEYGGSFENRARVLLEIVDSIRAHVPRSFPLSIRVSVSDYETNGIPIEETVQLCRMLEEHGVDVIHASGGHHARMEWEVSSWFMPRQPHRWGWERIKPAVSIPVIASGSLVTPEIAEEVLASGSADFVSLGRAMLADPDWTEKARTGRRLEIVPCIRCNDGCLERGVDQKRGVLFGVVPAAVEIFDRRQADLVDRVETGRELGRDHALRVEVEGLDQLEALAATLERAGATRHQVVSTPWEQTCLRMDMPDGEQLTLSILPAEEQGIRREARSRL